MNTTVSRRSFLRGASGTGIGVGLTMAGLATGLTACNRPAKTGKTGQLTYEFLVNQPQPDVALVQAAVNARLKALGIDVAMDLKPVQDYDTKMKLEVAAGSAGDLFFTAPWANNFFNNAAQGNLLALDDLLPKTAPKLWASLSPSIWDAARFKGKIYAVINQQRFPKMWGYNGQQKMLDKYHVAADQPNSFADLEPLLAKVKQGESGITPWNTDKLGNGRLFYPEIFGWDPIATAYGLTVRYDDDDLKVFNMYDTPEYEAACVLSRRWNQSGYSVANPPSSTDASSQYNAGKIAFGSGQQTPTNPQFTSFKTNGKCFVNPLLLNTEGVAATLVGVNAKTPEPEKAVQYLEAINTDDELYNLMCFGIEGKHYEFTDKALKVVGFPTGVTATSDRWNPNTDWAFGNQLNSFYRTMEDAKAKRWEVEGALNKSATPSKAIGFSLDVAKLETEAATVSAAILELEPQASIGLVGAPKGRDQLLKKMQASGSDKLVAAAQQQIDDWKATK